MSSAGQPPLPPFQIENSFFFFLMLSKRDESHCTNASGMFSTQEERNRFENMGEKVLTALPSPPAGRHTQTPLKVWREKDQPNGWGLGGGGGPV